MQAFSSFRGPFHRGCWYRPDIEDKFQDKEDTSIRMPMLIQGRLDVTNLMHFKNEVTWTDGTQMGQSGLHSLLSKHIPYIPDQVYSDLLDLKVNSPGVAIMLKTLSGAVDLAIKGAARGRYDFCWSPATHIVVVRTAIVVSSIFTKLVTVTKCPQNRDRAGIRSSFTAPGLGQTGPTVRPRQVRGRANTQTHWDNYTQNSPYCCRVSADPESAHSGKKNGYLG